MAAALLVAAFACLCALNAGHLIQQVEATSINIWKHRYPFYGGYGGYYPFWGGYGGYGGISLGGFGGGYGR